MARTGDPDSTGPDPGPPYITLLRASEAGLPIRLAPFRLGQAESSVSERVAFEFKSSAIEVLYYQSVISGGIRSSSYRDRAARTFGSVFRAAMLMPTACSGRKLGASRSARSGRPMFSYR